MAEREARAPSRIIRDLGTDDTLLVLREWLAAYDTGWKPDMFVVADRDITALRVRKMMAEVYAFDHQMPFDPAEHH